MWRDRYETPERFFAWAFVANYCPLVFMEESGRNLTPDKLRSQRSGKAVQKACDEHLRKVIETLRASLDRGRGEVRRGTSEDAVAGAHRLPSWNSEVACMPHPSPASPAANRNWKQLHSSLCRRRACQWTQIPASMREQSVSAWLRRLTSPFIRYVGAW